MKKLIIKNIYIDCVIFRFDSEKINVLLVDQFNSQSMDHQQHDLAITGHSICADEDLDLAAARIIHEITGLNDLYLEQLCTRFSDPRGREGGLAETCGAEKSDSRYKEIRIGYYALIHDVQTHTIPNGDASRWVPLSALDPQLLSNQHTFILRKAIRQLQCKISTDPVAFELLPDKFTLPQLKSLYEEILGMHIDKRNFRKKIMRTDCIIPLKEHKNGITGRPAQLYMFSKDVYIRTHRRKPFSLVVA